MAIDSNALDAFKESGGRPLQPFDPRGDDPRGDDSRGDAFKELGRQLQPFRPRGDDNSTPRSPRPLDLKPWKKIIMEKDEIDKGSEEKRRPQPSDLRGSGNMISTPKPQPFDLRESGNMISTPTTDSRIR